MNYVQWLPCDVVADADTGAVAAVVTTIVEHIAAQCSAFGFDPSQLQWSCCVKIDPYPVYAISAAVV